MSHDEFIAESLGFPPGKICVVSGPDLSKIFLLLMDARTAIINAGTYSATVVDAKALVTYPSDTSERGVSFEYVAISSPNTVVLVPNQFDREDDDTNTTNVTVEIDVVFDILSKKTVETIPESLSKTFPGIRNIFPFISRIYYYDTRAEDIAFVKTQTPIR
jgi:hypothetical protein